MRQRTAAPMTAQGPRKGEPSLSSVRNGLRPQPAFSVRGSSRRIMTLRFRPAHIRVINRRVCSWAVLGPAVPKPCSKLTSGNVFPPLPLVDAAPMPERCSPSRVRFAAPNCGAPLTVARRSGQARIATSGSGGNTRPLAPKTKAGVPPVGRNAGRNQNTVKPGGA